MAPKHAKYLLCIKDSWWEEKLKTCQEQQGFVCGHFMKVFYKTTTCPKRPLLSGPKIGHLIQRGGAHAMISL